MSNRTLRSARRLGALLVPVAAAALLATPVQAGAAAPRYYDTHVTAVVEDLASFGSAYPISGPNTKPAWNLLNSVDGVYHLRVQNDGNIVIYHGTKAIWATNTVGAVRAQLQFQHDGNIVIYDGRGRAIWATHTALRLDFTCYDLVMQTDGNLVYYIQPYDWNDRTCFGTRRAIWTSNTRGR